MKLRRPKKLPDIHKLWNFLLAMSQDTVFAGVAALLVVGLQFWRLGSLTPGLSSAEINTLSSASSLSVIFENLVNAPYKLAVFASTSVFDNAFGLRLVGAGLGVVSVVIFFLLVRRLFNHYITLASTAMYATSSLFLAVTRQATANVMLLSLLALVGVGFFLRFNKRPDIGWLLAAFVIGLTIYVPGMILFIVAAIVWQFRHARKSFENLKTPVITAASILLGVLVAPLIIGLIRNPGLWRELLGFPEQFAAPLEMLKVSAVSLRSLFVYSVYEPTWWLGRQPILDILASAMLVIGGWTLLKQFRLDRLWTIAGIFLITLVYIGATGNRLGVVIILPFIYLVIGIGLQNFVNLWLNVFPRNPIARWFGGLLLFGALVLSVNFQLQRYYIAWPNNDQTKAVFAENYPS